MSHSEFLLSDIFASDFSPSPVPKHRQVVEERAPPAAAAPSDVAESSRRAGGVGSQPSEDIPVGEPIIPPYNGSKVLPVARLLHAGKTTGVSPDAEVEVSSDSLLDEIRASPPPFECYHGEQLEDDPQLTARNMKKFQAVVREFTKFSLVSTIVEYFFLVWNFLCANFVVAANGQSVISEVSEVESD